MADQTSDGADRGERNSLDLDALAVSDRFRLFNFTRRDDHVAYLWVLRALDRLRAVHQVQAHTDDVAAALAELERSWPGKPSLAPRRSSNLGACVPGDLNPYVSEGGLEHRNRGDLPGSGKSCNKSNTIGRDAPVYSVECSLFVLSPGRYMT
jgi:hypothetical protein